MSDEDASAGYWLKLDSEEANFIVNYINACLYGRGEVGKIEIWKIENSELKIRYERRGGNSLKIVALDDATALGNENSIQDVCARGFVFRSPPGGKVFTTGLLPALSRKDYGSNVASADSDIEYSIIYSEVAIGRSKVCDEAEITLPVPPGYDSFYISQKPLDRNQDGEFSLLEYKQAANFDNRSASEYCHRYMVKDPNQILPKYIIHFTLVSAQGNKVIVPEGINESELEYDFFDPNAYKPISNKDRKGLSGSKQFVTIQSAYEQALIDMQLQDPLLSGKIDWMEKQLDLVDEKVRLITLNYAEIQEAISEAAKKATAKLQLYTRQKLETLLSTEVELRRQKENITWMDAVLERNRKASQVALASAKLSSKEKNFIRLQLLKSWKFHTLHRTSMARLKPVEMQSLSTVKPNIKFGGDLRVYLDLDEEMQQSSAGNTSSTSSPPRSPGRRSVVSTTPGATTASKANSAVEESSISKYLTSLGNSGVYEDPLRPSDKLISQSLQKLIDIQAMHIKGALARAMEDPNLPMPSSITNPNIAGDAYPLPLPDILKTAKNSGAYNNDMKGSFDNTMRGIMGLSVGATVSVTSASAPPAVSTTNKVTTHTNSAITNKPIAGAIVSQGAAPTSEDLINREAFSGHQVKPLSAVVGSNKGQPEEKNDDNLSMSVEKLLHVVAKWKPLLLSDIAEKKIEQLQQKNIEGYEIPLSLLETSSILVEAEPKHVYFSMPFFTRPPNVQLLYTTKKHRRSLDELYLKTFQNRNPSIVVVKSGDFKFGVYITHPIHKTSKWSGSAACYIFSLTLNTKIVYNARVPPDTGSEITTPVAFYAETDRLIIGNYDLVIDSTVTNGVSELEHCFGIGAPCRSDEAKCMLAGSPTFTIDELEVWGLIV